MKRAVMLLAIVAMLILPACTPDNPDNKVDNPTKNEEINISLWTYPVGGWGNSSTVSAQLAAFHRQYPNIRVNVKYVDYETGDKEVEDAIKDGKAPDIILEGPERLVANWGARGLMADISDMFQSEKAREIDEKIIEACHDQNGKYFIYPMCMTTHCMAINKDLFEAADAMQYIDEPTHTWKSTEAFFNAVRAVNDYSPAAEKDPPAADHVAAVYCKGQGGDQGTRALVNNLYGGTFTNAEHTDYTVDSEANIRALKELKQTEGIIFAPDMTGTDEIEKFCKGELAMAFCWNVFMEIKQTINPGVDFDVFPMAFPTDDVDKIELQGGIWGFGIFDNKDSERIEAAKTFIKFFMEDDDRYASAVKVSTYWPVKDIDLYVNDNLMNEYQIFGQYLGDYYQVTPGWAEARTAWWQMLQKIGETENIDDIDNVVSEFF